MLITKQTDCSCDANEHTFTTVSVDEQDEMTLERRMCVCTGCFECEAREVRVIPHTASSGRRYADPIA